MAGQPGRAVQVDPNKPMLKPPGTQHLKLKCDELLSRFAFKFNLRRYNQGRVMFFLGNKYGADLCDLALELPPVAGLNSRLAAGAYTRSDFSST